MNRPENDDDYQLVPAEDDDVFVQNDAPQGQQQPAPQQPGPQPQGGAPRPWQDNGNGGGNGNYGRNNGNGGGYGRGRGGRGRGGRNRGRGGHGGNNNFNRGGNRPMGLPQDEPYYPQQRPQGAGAVPQQGGAPQGPANAVPAAVPRDPSLPEVKLADLQKMENADVVKMIPNANPEDLGSFNRH